MPGQKPWARAVAFPPPLRQPQQPRARAQSRNEAQSAKRCGCCRPDNSHGRRHGPLSPSVQRQAKPRCAGTDRAVPATPARAVALSPPPSKQPQQLWARAWSRAEAPATAGVQVQAVDAVPFALVKATDAGSNVVPSPYGLLIRQLQNGLGGGMWCQPSQRTPHLQARTRSPSPPAQQQTKP